MSGRAKWFTLWPESVTSKCAVAPNFRFQCEFANSAWIETDTGTVNNAEHRQTICTISDRYSRGWSCLCVQIAQAHTNPPNWAEPFGVLLLSLVFGFSFRLLSATLEFYIDCTVISFWFVLIFAIFIFSLDMIFFFSYFSISPFRFALPVLRAGSVHERQTPSILLINNRTICVCIRENNRFCFFW